MSPKETNPGNGTRREAEKPISRFMPGMLREMMIASDMEACGRLLVVDVTGTEHVRVLSALGHFVGPRQPLYCVDAGNLFDPFAFVSVARGRGEDPRKVLENIYVSRVFTCHQLHTLMKEVPGLPREPHSPLVMVLGFSDLFHDENLPFWEREYFYRGSLEEMNRARKAGLSLAVTFRERTGGSGGRLWRSLLCRQADRITHFRENQESSVLSSTPPQSKAPLPDDREREEFLFSLSLPEERG